MQSPDIEKAKVLEKHKLLITFKNGEEKVFDLEAYLKYPVFKPLENIDEFNNFKIIDGTIEWQCGADLSPDTFFIESVPLDKLEDAVG